MTAPSHTAADPMLAGMKALWDDVAAHPERYRKPWDEQLEEAMADAADREQLRRADGEASRRG